MKHDHITGITDQLVKDCDLDTASIFFCDRAKGELSLSYLYHVGVSDEAQAHYQDHQVFICDPFVRLPFAENCGRAVSFHRWGDRRLDPFAADSANYREFLSMHDVNVVGALSRRVSSNLCMVIGTHRRHGAGAHGAVPMEMLEDRLGKLSDVVVEYLLDMMLELPAGKAALQSALSTDDDETDGRTLSSRELKIVDLICKGKQNKEVAYLLGISRHTVENHLRRIYRKLAIHNRAALVGRMSMRLN